ncbi:hypothetical protein BH23GEM6_BH23GEM6_25690 [soil metagenome]
MKQSANSEKPGQPAAALAMLVIGISLNAVGVVMIALRGIAWIGLLLMLVGLALLLISTLRITADARRTPAEID